MRLAQARLRTEMEEHFRHRVREEQMAHRKLKEEIQVYNIAMAEYGRRLEPKYEEAPGYFDTEMYLYCEEKFKYRQEIQELEACQDELEMLTWNRVENQTGAASTSTAAKKVRKESKSRSTSIPRRTRG